MPWLRRYSRTKSCEGAQMAIFRRFLRPVFAASRVQHISDMHSKFALRPHHVWKYMVDIQSATAEIRRGKKKERNKQTKKPQNENIMYASATQGGHKERIMKAILLSCNGVRGGGSIIPHPLWIRPCRHTCRTQNEILISSTTL